MFNVLKGISELAKLNSVRTGYETFRLHYTFTVVILLTFSVVVTSTQIVGSPIICDYNREERMKKLMNTYCWIHSTFLNPGAFNKSVGDEVPHPGIDSSPVAPHFRFYRYYQWVYFMFFLQAILFYIPRWLWKTWEGRKMETLTSAFDNILVSERDKKKKLECLVKYIVKTWKMHNWYAAKYLVCEFLALANVVGQLFILHRFFDGEFLRFGVDVVRYAVSFKYSAASNATGHNRMDPKIMLFPHVTKCIFRKYGKGSNIETHDALCVMTINIINEKFYIFLWFWFVILAVLSAMAFISNALLIFIPWLRSYALFIRARSVDQRKIYALIRRGTFGDFFLLDLLSLNVDRYLFKEIQYVTKWKQ
ncbi:Innexin shaking-B [Araneus ventricosus]|uniref:Innexin n=1 Tax=Araneus ventricosus TaxID=182803 RepID=A0A4Y2UAN0_ARAVE|nr:Innexin shaking-B [Araneus ventricosus]